MTPKPFSWREVVLVGLALLVALALMIDQARRSSATYDETTYLRVAARWWRTGEQGEIARMGSPLTFWKIQQGPTLWLLDRLGHADWIDDPIGHQAELLPVIRMGTLWIGLVAGLVTAVWAFHLHGPRAMVMASAIFALSPNLLAHGSLATMEMPLVAAAGGVFATFWWFLRTGKHRAFWLSAGLTGLAGSCKFTAILIPPILGALWFVDLRIASPDVWWRSLGTVIRGMVGFAVVMVLVNLGLTGMAMIPLSENAGHHPSLSGRVPGPLAPFADWLLERSYPQDWVAFAVQTAHQRNGGPSYLFGETRMTGWSYYYLVALAVKLPIAVGVLLLARLALVRRDPTGQGTRDRGCFPILVVLAFVLLASLGSKRNYGVRYLLPVAVPAIVWISALAERGRLAGGVGWSGVACMGLSLAMIHPHELSYFNVLAGGPIGGRQILSDSNLDWGQGLRGLACLQKQRPELRDLTLYYFGDTDPRHYGVVGRSYTIDANHVPADLPNSLAASTNYLAVSSSLAWGPWGPPGYFAALDGVTPVLNTEDATIAIYRVEALRLETRRGAGYDGFVHEAGPGPTSPSPEP